jgi:hypothetical protein
MAISAQMAYTRGLWYELLQLAKLKLHRQVDAALTEARGSGK